MKTKYPKIKLSKEDKIAMLADIMTLQEVAKKIWGDAIYLAEDFGMETLAWQWHLEKIISAKDPKKTLKQHLNDR